MTPKELAENVKRIRSAPNDRLDMMETINALVQLVGEMSEVLKAYQTGVSTDSPLMDAWDKARPLILQAPDSTLGREVFEMALDEIEEAATAALTKSAPIAELAKEK